MSLANLGEALKSAGRVNSPREAAMILAQSGIPIFPCKHDKRPLTNHGFQDASCEIPQVESWWNKWPDAWLGLPTGEKTGIIVVDVDCKDGKDGHANLVASYGEPPATFAISTPSGGYHLFYKWPGSLVKCSQSKIAVGVDVRGDGGYVIFPPSGNYRLKCLSDIAPCPSWGCVTERQSIGESEKLSNGAPEILKPYKQPPPPPPVTTTSMTITEAIDATLPKSGGGRNAAIFNFARAMKFECGYGEKLFKANDHLPHVKEWHRRALSVISTKAFDDTLADYLHGFKSATTPLKANPLPDAWAKSQESPPSIPDLGFPLDELSKRLYGLLYWLGILAGDNPFWASTRDTGKLLGENSQTIWRRFTMFENLGVLTVIEKGTQGVNGKATRYKWTQKQ